MCKETGMDVSYVILFFLRHLSIVTGSPWLPSINITHKPATVSGCVDGLVAGVDRLNLHVSVHSAAQADWHVGRHFGLVRHSHQNGSEELVCFFAFLSATQCKGIKQIQEVHSCNCSDHLSTQSILLFTAEMSVQMSDQKNGYVFFWNATNTSEPTESSDTYSSTMWTLPVQIVDNVTYCRSDHRRIVRRVEDLKRLPPNLIIQPPPILILQPYETIHPSERRCKFGLLDKEGELFVRVFVNASNSWRINKTLGFVRSNIYYDFNLTAMDELCTMKFKTVTNARYEWNPSDCCTCSVRNAVGGMMVSMAMTVNMYYQLWPVTFFWASSDGGKVERMYSPKYYIEETIYRNKEECEREGNNLTAGVDKEKIRKIRIRQYQSPENLCDYGIVEFKDIITLRAYVNIGAYTSWLVEKQFGFQRHWQYIPTRIDCLIKFTSKETYESNSPGMYSCEAFIIYNEGHVVFIFRTTVPRLFWYIPYSFFYNLPVLGAQGIYKKIETKKFFIKDDIYKSLNECMSTTVKRTKQRPPDEAFPEIVFEPDKERSMYCEFGMVESVDYIFMRAKLILRQFDWFLYKVITVVKVDRNSSEKTLCRLRVEGSNLKVCRLIDYAENTYCDCVVTKVGYYRSVHVNMTKPVDAMDMFNLYHIVWYDAEQSEKLIGSRPVWSSPWKVKGLIYQSVEKCRRSSNPRNLIRYQSKSGATIMSPHQRLPLGLLLQTCTLLVTMTGVL